VLFAAFLNEGGRWVSQRFSFFRLTDFCGAQACGISGFGLAGHQAATELKTRPCIGIP
jgi:hypothetical protein